MREFSFFYLGYFVPACTLLPLVAGLIYYRQINKPLRVLLIYLTMSFVVNVVGSILAEYSINNLPLLHFYTMAEVVTVMLYYIHAFGEGDIRKWIKAVMVVFPVICVVNLLFFQSINEYNTYTRPLGAIIIVLFSGVYMAEQSNIKSPELVTRSGRTIAAGLMIYFCSSLFQFIFSNIVSKNASKFITMLIWNIHGTFVLIMYLLFFRAILYERSKRQY